MELIDESLEWQLDYAPALLERGRVLLGFGKTPEAIETLKRAAVLNPLPEYQWTLSEALRAADRIEEAQAVEAELKRQGAANDPRTFSLFLATRGEDVPTALRLAKTEGFVAIADKDLYSRTSPELDNSVFPYESTPQNGRNHSHHE